MGNNKNKGFSLTELAVTLVIAGLLMSAITSGSNLLQASKLNKVATELSGYVTAVNNFKDKYKAWPGDMANATGSWGAYSAGPPITGTNDGNGDERISGITTEALYAWRDMSLAGMISGNYTGVSAGTQNFVSGANAPGANMPASTVDGISYFLYYFSAATTSYAVFGTSGNALQAGAMDTTTSPWISSIVPGDAHLIDTKIDDGLASSGNIYSIPSAPSGVAAVSASCVDNNYASASANYILSDTTQSCRMLYWLNKI